MQLSNPPLLPVQPAFVLDIPSLVFLPPVEVNLLVTHLLTLLHILQFTPLVALAVVGVLTLPLFDIMTSLGLFQEPKESIADSIADFFR